jgi:hypothetical protein
MGVNVPNFGPGTEPGVLRRWAQTVEGLGFDLLMISDHIAVTPDVAGQYPAPFYEPFTTLAWLAGVTGRIRLGTIGQVLGDLAELRLLGADTVVLDPFSGDPDETLRPEAAWQALATIWARTPHLRE